MKSITEISSHYYNKGLVSFNSKNITEAVSNLNKSIELFSKDIDSLNLLGLIYYVKADFNKALRCWKDSLAVSSENNVAINYLNYIESESFNRIIHIFNNGIEAYDTEDYYRCISVIKEVVEEAPDIIESYEILASCFVILGEYKKAKKWVNQIKRLDLTNEKAIYLEAVINESIEDQNNMESKRFSNKNLGFILLGLIVILLAINIYQNYVNNNLKDIYADEKFSFQATINRTEESNRVLKVTNELLVNELETFIDSKENEVAETINPSLGIIVNDEKATFNSALVLFKNKKYLDAVDEFLNIVNHGTELYLIKESTYYIAVAYEKYNDIDEAMKWFSQYIDNYIGGNYYDDSLYNYGLLLYKYGYTEEAKGVFNRLVKEVPGSIFNNSRVNYILTATAPGP